MYLPFKVEFDAGKWIEMSETVTDNFHPCISDTATPINQQSEYMFYYMYLQGEVKVDAGQWIQMFKTVTDRQISVLY